MSSTSAIGQARKEVLPPLVDQAVLEEGAYSSLVKIYEDIFVRKMSPARETVSGQKVSSRTCCKFWVH